MKYLVKNVPLTSLKQMNEFKKSLSLQSYASLINLSTSLSFVNHSYNSEVQKDLNYLKNSPISHSKELISDLTVK